MTTRRDYASRYATFESKNQSSPEGRPETQRVYTQEQDMMTSNRRPMAARSRARVGPDFKDFGDRNGGPRAWSVAWNRRVGGRYEQVVVRVQRDASGLRWRAAVAVGRWLGVSNSNAADAPQKAASLALQQVRQDVYRQHGGELAAQVGEDVERVLWPTLAWVRLRMSEANRTRFDQYEVNPYGMPRAYVEERLQERGTSYLEELARVQAEWHGLTVRTPATSGKIKWMEASGGANDATFHNIQREAVARRVVDDALVVLLFRPPEQSGEGGPRVGRSRTRGGAQ